MLIESYRVTEKEKRGRGTEREREREKTKKGLVREFDRELYSLREC
jgi:hypothetical protein